MTKDINELIIKLNKKHNRRMIRYRILSILMCITVFFTTYALILPAITIEADEIGYPRLSVSAEWDDENNVPKNVTFECDVVKDYTYILEYTDNGGSVWTTIASSGKIADNNTTVYEFSGSTVDALIASADMNTRYRVHLGKLNNKGEYENNSEKYTYSLKLADILEGVKEGYSDWLKGDYLVYFCDDDPAAPPSDTAELLAVFDEYYHLPSASVSASVPSSASDPVVVNAYVDISDTYTFEWQKQVTNADTGEAEWVTISGENGASITDTASCLPYGGTNVRCRVFKDGNYQTTSNVILVNPQKWDFDQAVTKINTGLSLSTTNGCGDSYDLTLNGTIFNKYLYFDGVASNPDVPFSDAETYRWYLCKTYLDAYNAAAGDESAKNTAGVAASREVWERYLYDIFDPGAQNLGNTGSGSYAYPTTGGYGDHTLAWPKSGDSSFHANAAPQIDPLNYDFLVGGVDYTNFVSDLDKYAYADKAGDANTERTYNVNITADGTAKAKAPVAIIFQIQTAWQLFDLDHANALAGDGHTEVGAVAFNGEIATLYDIKCALLDFVEYMNTTYPGNNLVVGVVEVQHNGSSTMFSGTDASGKPMYVTNNPDVLKEGIIGWDIFGNCEHVHYDNNALVNAVTNLPSNLSTWNDLYGHPIAYDDIQKIGIIIGGPTENTNSTNGLGCTLPWSTFKASKLNSVYSIRVNEGTPVANNVMNPDPIISWLDYSANNGTPYKDGNNGTGFTQKYVATSRKALYDTFVEIAEREMSTKYIVVSSDTSAYVENVMIDDVIRPEFKVDLRKPVIASIKDSDGTLRYETIVDFSSKTVNVRTYAADGTYTEQAFDAEFTEQSGLINVQMDFNVTRGADVGIPNSLTIIENSDKTTNVSYNFGKLYNTTRAVLDFGIVAREDYLGSNNVYTNVGTPAAKYAPPQSIREENTKFVYKDFYTVKCFDEPQVNVPLDFTTVNGGFEIIPKGQSKDFYALDCGVIPNNIEDLMDNYGQINGTLYYKWVGPNDGEGRECGSVRVTGGVPQGERPDLSYPKTFYETGSFASSLELTFVPDEVDPKGTFHDRVTKTEVNEKMRDGVANVLVIDENSLLSLEVEKIWKGSFPHADQIGFDILDKNGNVFRTGTLGSSDNWHKFISDLPAIINNETQTYSISEIGVEGYVTSMQSEITTEYVYEGLLEFDFKPQINIPSGYTKIRVYYTYGDSGEGTYRDFTVSSLNVDDSNRFTISGLGVDEDGNPYEGGINRIDYIDDSEKIYASFIGPDLDPYSVTAEQCGYALFSITPSAKVDKDRYVEIRYTVGSDTTVYAYSYKLPAAVNAGTSFTLTDTSNLLPADTNASDITIMSVRMGQQLNNLQTLNCTSSCTGLGTAKQTVYFNAPKKLQKGKNVYVTISDGNGNTYTQTYKLTADVNMDERVTVVFDDFLPDGTYTLDSIAYDQNNNYLADDTFVAFKLPIRIAGKNVTVTIRNDDTGNTYSQTTQINAEADTDVTVVFANDPPAGNYSLVSITYTDGGTKYVMKKTVIEFTAPVDFAERDVLVFTLTNGTDTITESVTLTKNQANAMKAGNLIELELATTNDTTGYYVSGITRNASPLTDMTKVTFTAPVKITADKDLAFTFWDGTNDATTTSAYTARADMAYEAGSDLTVTLNGNPPEGYVIKTMTFDGNSLASKTAASFITPMKFDGKTDVKVTITDGSHTYTSTIKPKAAAGEECTAYFDNVVSGGTYQISKIEYGKNTLTGYTSPTVIPGGALPEYTVDFGGAPVEAHLFAGGMYPSTVIYIGGNYPGSEVRPNGISRITAGMLTPCDIPAGTEITVYYENDGVTGSFTYTTTQATSAGDIAYFNSGALPGGDYVITGVSHPYGTSDEHMYYYDIPVNASTKSKLISATSTPHYTITNTPEVSLPSTGGSTARTFTAIGLAIMLAALIAGGFLLKKKG